MGIFFDDWQACLRSHYIYVIRAGDEVTEPTLRHVLLHSGVGEAELEALRAQAERLGPLDSGAPVEAVRDPAPDAASAGDPSEDGDAIGVADAAFDEGDLLPEDEIGEPDDGRFDEDDADDEDGIYDDEGDSEPPVAPNQLSLF